MYETIAVAKPTRQVLIDADVNISYPQEMAKSRTNREGYQKVLETISKSVLAKKLRLTRQAVGNWGDEVPEAYAYRVSLLTSVPIEEIVPEVARDVRRKLKEYELEEAEARQARQGTEGAQGRKAQAQDR